MDCLANGKTGMALADVDRTKITIFLINTREGRTLQKAFNASSNVLLFTLVKFKSPFQLVHF